MSTSNPRMKDNSGDSQMSGREMELGRVSERLQDSSGKHPGRRQPRYVTLLNAALASLLLFMASPLARHWLMEFVSTVCILGGIVAAPLVSMVAWIGLVLPTHALLHRLAPALVAVSLIWFCMAIVGSHALRLEQRRRNEIGAVDGSEGGRGNSSRD